MTDFKNNFQKLKFYCESENFKGWDPYDGLNSWVIQKTPLKKSRFFRLAWIQLFKRNPINLRGIVGIKKDYNPKGLGLFLIGYCNLYKIENKQEYLDKINEKVISIGDGNLRRNISKTKGPLKKENIYATIKDLTKDDTKANMITTQIFENRPLTERINLKRTKNRKPKL
jgi:hypothetical protein